MTTFLQSYVTVWLAPGADPAGDPGDWSWTNITADVRISSGITIEAGRGDEAQRVDPGKITLTLDDRDGDYNPRNPYGAWYGTLAKNTPMQVRITRVSDTFTRSSASGWGTADLGSAWTHTGTSTWTVTGTRGKVAYAAANTANYALQTDHVGRDVDFVYAAYPQSVTTGGPWISAVVARYTDANTHYRVHTEFKPTNVITAKITKVTGGVAADLIENLSLTATYTAGAKIWTRVQTDGPTIRARVWKDSDPEPATWDVQYDDSEITGSTFGFYQWRHTTNTNAGSLYIEIDSVTMTTILATGMVAEWPVRWDRTGNDATAPVEASGILRRLQQGASPLRSPLYRLLSSYSPAGYWPLEDGSDATVASSAVAGGVPATASNVTFAADGTLPGAETAMQIAGAGTKVAGRVLLNTGTGFAAMFLVKLNATPGSKTVFMDWSCSGTVRTWRISGDATKVYMDGLDSDGSVLSTSNAIYVENPTGWIAYQIEAVQSGGNISWTLLWHQVGKTDFWSIGTTVAGTVGRITAFSIAGSAGTADAVYAHVYAGADTLPFVADSFSKVSNGYTGELAADRVQRLCDEEGVRVLVESGDSLTMGAQQVTTFLGLLQDAEDADFGLLYEAGTGLGFRPHETALNPTAVLALDFAVGDVADPPEPTDDDQRVRNDITASRVSGSSVRATDEDHIAANGRYTESVTVNVETDTQLADHAGWRLHLGTWDELRWPRITLNLVDNTALIPAFLDVGVGSRITIANPPDQVAGDSLDLLVEGYAYTLTGHRWDATLTCAPARPWDVGVTDDSDARVDTDGSSLASSVTTTGASLSVTSTDAHHWTTSSGDMPFDILVGGERITVTAISGASNPQTFTVTRSVNGIIKAHGSGTDVRLWQPTYTAF